jgi:hypothetical protein
MHLDAGNAFRASVWGDDLEEEFLFRYCLRCRLLVLASWDRQAIHLFVADGEEHSTFVNIGG